MNVIKAADKMYLLINRIEFKRFIDPDTSKSHLLDMCNKIATEKITGEKAHRWLGWIQACVCIHCEVSLEELKQINLSS